ncbi:MAG TPA: hypothetical protein VJP45_14165 [Candidatus Limnocylindria bacterium]|nr:hypothetical protein [Candidatus Limnocylindria bacterium]
MARDVEADETHATRPKAATRDPGLRALDKLVGTWKASEGMTGRIAYEWLPGDHFLMARGETEQNGRRTSHVEIIGYDRELGAEPASVMTSRLYTDQGETLKYTHEVNDEGVTSWFGDKGSPTLFRAKWIDDDTLKGAWEWPGGGYKLTLTRVK